MPQRPRPGSTSRVWQLLHPSHRRRQTQTPIDDRRLQAHEIDSKHGDSPSDVLVSPSWNRSLKRPKQHGADASLVTFRAHYQEPLGSNALRYLAPPVRKSLHDLKRVARSQQNPLSPDVCRRLQRKVPGGWGTTETP